MIAGVLVIMWTGPLIFGWLLSMLLASDRDAIVYSFEALLRGLLFNGISLVALSAITLGVSALSRTSRNTTIIWIGLWIILGALAIEPRGPLWLRRASFSRDLSEVRAEVFRVDSAFADAAEKLPLFDQRFISDLRRAGNRATANDFTGALVSLGVMGALSSVVFFRKFRPE
jgi:hypothetical protein